LLAVSNLSAAALYVWQGSPSPAPPYNNWASAAHVIQTAVDAAVAGDEIVVTNGVYTTGGRAVGTNVLVNRVAVDKPLTVRSVNGPQFTIIRGAKAPGGGNGDGAIRCVYLTKGATLSGFTLTNGATRSVFPLQDFNSLEDSGGGVWCDHVGALVSNCVLTANSADIGGGGAYWGTLNNCTLIRNSVTGWDGSGGGAIESMLNDCTLTDNSASYRGGGAWGGTLNGCMLTGNSASVGGGTFLSLLNNCTLTGNLAWGLTASGWFGGGGAYGGTLNNCSLSCNWADRGGGAYSATLNNCTLTDNSASYSGGGAAGCALFNCIVHFNTATIGANYGDSTLNYCCTTPLPVGGTGNLSLDPQLASSSHLSASSPCRGAGSASFSSGSDIDGETWATPPSIGCDEYDVGAITGPLNVGIVATFTNVAVGFPVRLMALIEGRTTASVWDLGDGVTASNQPYVTHAWAASGDYVVLLRAFNESVPGGVSTSITVHVMVQPVHYVATASKNPLPPYTSWVTAATNIQDAVDAAVVPGALVLVTNGTYATDGRAVFGTMTNRVAVSKPLTVRSVNGPQVTVIQGYKVPRGDNGCGDAAIRCVYLTNGANLSGFTLTNGATRTDGDPEREQSGGGVWCECADALVSNCVLTGNSAMHGGGLARGTANTCTLTGNSAGSGGGAVESTLNNCALTGNRADRGGGASSATLNNCTLTGNSAQEGGGASESTLGNCIIYFNKAGNGENYILGTLNYCCTTPLPAGGTGNLSLDPQLASTSHLSASSHCRRAGSANCASGTDIDGETWATPPSIGCDEYNVGAITGPLSVGIAATFTNVAVGYPVRLMALVEGRTTASAWDLGDGVTATNQPYVTHAWAAPGDYVLLLEAFNESVPGGVSASITVHVMAQPVHYVVAGNTNTVAPYLSWTTAASNIQDAVDAAAVSGALVLVTNGLYASGGRAVFGTMTNRVAVNKPLTVRSVNGPQFTVIQGYKVPSGDNGCGDGAIRCVYLINRANLSGFTLTNGATGGGDWDREASGGGLWCESAEATASNCVVTCNSALGSGGGVYNGTLNNCSLTGNGANQGGGACRAVLKNCSLATNWAAYGGGIALGIANSCMLTGNTAGYGGGAAYQATLNNCTLTGNSVLGLPDPWGWLPVGGGAFQGTLHNCTLNGNSAHSGGGAAGAILYNCTLSDNSATGGGGAVWGTLYNCTVVDNLAWESGGGVASSTLANCIVAYNVSWTEPNHTDSTLDYCCTTPLPSSGQGNIALAPLFVDQGVGGAGNLRLRSDCPCINAGLNAYAPEPTDLDGKPRIVSGTVDMGAYEFQGPGSVISYAWLQQFGLLTDGSADLADADGDGMNNWQEWICGTCPTNQLSALRLVSAAPAGTNVTVSWQSVEGMNYFLERSTDLSVSPSFTLLAKNLPGQPGTTRFTDTNAAPLAPLFYRVGVRN
jgi:hypothetical protein